jgi:hypothetical protein
MLIKTHIIFSAGLLLFLTALITHDPVTVSVYTFTVSAVANVLIDKLGHEMVNVNGKSIPRRTPLTHTWFRSVLWGTLVSILLSPLLLPLTVNIYHYGNPRLLDIVTTVLVHGLIVGPSHMVLDVFTERGIYVKKDGKWVRFALAHFRYNNPYVNSLATFIGAILFITSFRV